MPRSSSPAPTPFRRAVRAGLVVAWAAVIFAASHRPDLRVAEDDLVDFVLRKAAHMVVFGVLAVLVARALQDERIGGATTLAAAWVAAVLYAVSDEWHQTFVDGRAGQVSDVGIDAAGATVALALFGRWLPPTPVPEEPS